MVAILVVLGLIVSVWAAISPRSLWWTTSAWRFKDPASNEPSDAAYTLSRIGGIAMVAVVAIVLVVRVTDLGDDRGSDRPRSAPTTKKTRSADTGALLRAIGGDHSSVRVETVEARPYWSLRLAGGRVVPMLGYIWVRKNAPAALWSAAGSADLRKVDLAVVASGECPVEAFVSEGTGGGVTGVTVALIVGAAPLPPDPPPPGVTPSPSASASAAGPPRGTGPPGAAGSSAGAAGSSAGADPSASGGACTGDPRSLVVLGLDLATSSTPDREVWDEATGAPTKKLLG